MNCSRCALGILLLHAAPAVMGRDPSYDLLWKDPEIEQRIENGIRTNRMGYATFRFVDAKGQPVSHVDVELNQTSHDFLFGSNLFYLGGYPDAERNRKYETAFVRLFNYATAPFYWSDLEPQPGRLRFEVDSPPIPRRPPPDLLIEFARAHGIQLKGHPLVWHQWVPKWLPEDKRVVERLLRKRMKEIAARYGASFYGWDVVNEPMERPASVTLPDDYVYWAMREACRLFPPESMLLLNEATTESWNNFRWENSPFYLMIQNLLLRNARIDAIGFQLHVFSEQRLAELKNGKAFRPADLFRVLDHYAKLSRPLHVTEITIPTLPAGAEGEQDQATVIRNLYRLWFSHEKVEAITYWNMVDGTAVEREIKLHAGLLREDLSPKPSYQELDRLINDQWRTRLRRNTGGEAQLRIHGFYGMYRLTARSEGEVIDRDVHLSRTGKNEFEIQF